MSTRTLAPVVAVAVVVLAPGRFTPTAVAQVAVLARAARVSAPPVVGIAMPGPAPAVLPFMAAPAMAPVVSAAPSLSAASRAAAPAAAEKGVALNALFDNSSAAAPESFAVLGHAAASVEPRLGRPVAPAAKAPAPVASPQAARGDGGRPLSRALAWTEYEPLVMTAAALAAVVVAPIPGAALAFSLVLTALMTVDSVLEDEFSRWARDRMTALALGVAFGGALGLALGSGSPVLVAASVAVPAAVALVRHLQFLAHVGRRSSGSR